jgi:hypothetical protein
MAGTWQKTSYPEAGVSIDGDNIVGSSGSHAFLYNDKTKNLITFDALGASFTHALDISGDKIVGWCKYPDMSNKSFIYSYSESTWNFINNPDGDDIMACSISGDKIVCVSNGPDYANSFIYNDKDSTWTNIDVPGASSTRASDIDGDNIVGTCNLDGLKGFLFNGTTYTFFNVPGQHDIQVTGISGDNIIGEYMPNLNFFYQYGFIYNIPDQRWTTLVAPWGNLTSISDIDGSKIIGSYKNLPDGTDGGFIYTIPEPASLFLLALGALIAIRCK